MLLIDYNLYINNIFLNRIFLNQKEEVCLYTTELNMIMESNQKVIIIFIIHSIMTHYLYLFAFFILSLILGLVLEVMVDYFGLFCVWMELPVLIYQQ